jgi:CubicO group peptidase (beta-lactamase class C family)
MHPVSATVVIVTTLCCSVIAWAADPLLRAKPEDVGMSSERLAEIGEFVKTEIAREQLPGAVIGIARRGKLVYFESFGFRDKTTQAQMTPDAIFRLASMTKPMVAVAALQLFERGQLLMDEPLAKYFPKFANMQVAVMDAKGENVIDRVPAVRQITIQDLFRHTSGLIYGNTGTTVLHKMYLQSSNQAASTYTSAEFLDRLSSLPLAHQPGAAWNYGFGFDVLGLVVESISKQTLGSYLQSRVWNPLGMKDTGATIPADKLNRFSLPLPTDPETGQPQPQRPATFKYDCGGICSVSTAGDYLRFVQMLVDKGKVGDTRILGRKTVEYMLSNQIGADVENRIGSTGSPVHADYGFGLGVAVRTTPGVVRTMGSVGDFSWPGANGTYWWGDTHEELAAVWMASVPSPFRRAYWQKFNALVYGAIID